ncbi:MAG: hypothetical protein R3Y60_02490 [bacterium]
MDINNSLSKFTYLGNSIKKLNIKNEIVNVIGEVSPSFDLDFNIIEVSKKESNLYGIILMDLKVEINVNDNISKFEFQFEGAFTGVEISENEFNEILMFNGAACLYSIARSKVENISSLTFNNYTIKLPMINMNQFIKNKLEN